VQAKRFSDTEILEIAASLKPRKKPRALRDLDDRDSVGYLVCETRMVGAVENHPTHEMSLPA
jgi:hypothetical protein